MIRNHLYSLEVWLTEQMAQHGWRYVRPFVARHLSQRCQSCILSVNFTQLNREGICHHCETFRSFATAEETSESVASAINQSVMVDTLLNQMVGAGKKDYDALLLLSGGKDSAYLLHELIKKYPQLRLLCVLVDNGFMSPFALANAQRVIDFFQVPYQILRSDPQIVRHLFKYALTHLDLQKDYSIVDLLDGHTTFDHARNFALDHDIPFVLCGLSRVQMSYLFGLDGFELTLAAERKPLEQDCGIPIASLVPQNVRYWFSADTPTESVPRVISPIAAWHPEEEKILALVTELGLLNRHRSRPLMTNNALIPVIAMAEMARFGHCCWEFEFARMVREGKSDRRYWLALFEMLEYTVKTGRFINRNVDRTLQQLGLSRVDLGIGK